jgi:N-acetylglucosaminyldiphosphoundecaprenol N-acetyl-beta-D-mannosaminyltransferase
MPAALASAPDHTEPSQLFDLPIETEPPADLLRRIIGFTEGNERKRVAYVNAHVINQSFGIPEVRRALISSDVVYCDGYGVRLAAKAIGRPVPHRMAGRSLYLLGSDPGASAEAAAELKRWYPSLRITGTHHGYFEQGSPHEQRVLEHINAHKPDILLVGMGTPQQEVWVERHFDEVDAKVVWTVGALFEYVSGRIKRAPHWMSDNGLEWIFRLAVEPRRMWRRYLLGNPVFLHRVLEERRRRTKDPL